MQFKEEYRQRLDYWSRDLLVNAKQSGLLAALDINYGNFSCNTGNPNDLWGLRISSDNLDILAHIIENTDI